MSEETQAAPPTNRELAQAMVAVQLQELEARVAQAFASLQILQIQLQGARIRAPQDVERLVTQLGND